ncbi:MAG: hypothetical protein K5682_04820 [Lachnospiraceae bacterium]|nr:hypothetical protein [Lachnospiraceae bacterium]
MKQTKCALCAGLFILAALFFSAVLPARAKETGNTKVPCIQEIYVNRGETVTLLADAYDEGGAPLRYQWHLLRSKKDVDTGYNNVVSLDIRENEIVELKVTDPEGRISRKQVKIEVFETDPPKIAQIRAYPAEYTADDVEVMVEASGEELLYSFDGGKTFSKSDRCQVQTNGTYSVVVKDGKGQVASADLTIYNIDRKPPEILDMVVRKEGILSGDLWVHIYAGDEGAGLASRAYSFDGGETYQETGRYQLAREDLEYYMDPSHEMKICVKDAAGNVASAGLPLSTSVTAVLSDTTEDAAKRGWKQAEGTNTATGSFAALLTERLEDSLPEGAEASEEERAQEKALESIRLKKVIKTVRTVAVASAAGTASGGILLFLFRVVFYANVYNRSAAGDYEECGSCKIRKKKGVLHMTIGKDMLQEKETVEWKCTFSKAFLFLHKGQKIRIYGPDKKRKKGHDLEIAETAYFTL